MSDDECISGEDWLDLDDFPYNEAEDLATHTIPSPPYIESDLDYDESPNTSDWEYDHDDYWDQDKLSKKRRKNVGEDTNEIKDEPKNKRRRLDSKEDTPGFAMEGSNTAAPTVIWKSKRDQLIPLQGPIVRTGQGEKVALLKDWRERFRSQPNHGASWPESKPINRRGSQIATAVVIRNGSPEPYHSTTLPPTTLEKRPDLPSRSRVFPPIPEHQHPEVNGTTPQMSDLQPISEDSNSARLVRNSTTTGKKRNISELANHQEDEVPAPKKRPGPPKKTTYNPETSKQPLANRTNSSIPASRKRKADDSADQSITSPQKRTQTTKMMGEARASEGEGSYTRRTTRRSR
ncbi:hypothetical protein JMJ35_004170 [Cladonia borealis]|uniref:Uncharacterized protein n=1 Tax=Cladonia borealis TaxID=184061 RepID=A0AA39R3X9_9LECA|nr:hypothetical protein JMJ35_004170 [Cladonia borealis]